MSETNVEEVAEKFADGVMDIVDILVQQAQVSNEVTATVITRVLDLLTEAFDAGAHLGADIAIGQAEKLVDVLVGGQ